MVADVILNEAVRLTFEEMAFLDVAPGPVDSPPSSPEEGPVLYLEYSRPHWGSLALFLPKEIKFQVAEAIYGESWEGITTLQLDDSLLELLNVLAGRLLTERFGAGHPYTMGLPSVLYEAPEAQEGLDCREFLFHLDSFPFSLVWCEARA